MHYSLSVATDTLIIDLKRLNRKLRTEGSDFDGIKPVTATDTDTTLEHNLTCQLFYYLLCIEIHCA